MTYDETYPYNPDPMAYARAKAEMEKVALSYRDKIPVVVVRARRELGYAPTISLAEGMKETVKWYEAKGYV